MPRGKRTLIDLEIKDDVVDKLRLDVNEIKQEKEREQRTLTRTIEQVYRKAEQLYKEKEVAIEQNRLFSLREAYEYLRSKGIHISFRAFGGRIERGTIPFVKLGRKRYIPQAVLDNLVENERQFYTVKQAFEEYRKHDKNINLRAFIGRVEKGSIPSVKLGTRRLIPREAIEALTHVSDNYYTVSQAINELTKRGIKIKRNAFERRLDRGRIPHVKIGGRRFIHEDVLREIIERERR